MGAIAPNGTVTDIDLHDCKNLLDVYPEICNYENSNYMYRINIVPNAVFTGIFSLSFLLFGVTFVATRFKHKGFSISLMLGVLCELLGYAGRIMSWQDQWADTGFLMQIICLTIAPAFIAAGIYLCLRSIVVAFGAQNSRIPPSWYPRIFIPCDFISLVLQGAGGGMASVASQNKTDVTPGNNTMIAGLAFQVITLFVFIVLSLDFAQRTLRSPAGRNNDPALVALRNSTLFRAFLAGLALATIFIFIRCVFRVAELSGGWNGSLMGDQYLFHGLESVMITLAVLLLNVFHPNICFKQMGEFKKLGNLNIGHKSSDVSLKERSPQRF